MKNQYKLLPIIFIVLAFVAITSIYQGNIHRDLFFKKHKYITYEEYVDTSEVEPTSVTRGILVFNNSRYVSMGCELVENKSGYDDWERVGPLIDLNNIPHIHTLFDLSLPYSIYKEKNTDTFEIIKDTFVLKFKIYQD